MQDLKHFLPYLKAYRKDIILGLIVITLANIIAAYIPRIIGDTIDMFNSGVYSANRLLWNSVSIIGLTALSGAFMFITRKLIIVSSRKIEYDLRKDLIHSISLQPMSFFHQNSTGNLMAYATNDIAAAREFLGPAIMYSMNTITSTVFALYFMISIDSLTTAVALAPLPLIALVTFIIGKKVYKLYKNVQSHFANLTTISQESISGIRVVKAFGREESELGLFSKSSDEYLQMNLKLSLVQSLTMPVIMFLVGLSLILVLWYGGLNVIKNTITLGELTQFFIYLGLLIWPIAAIGWITNLIQRAAASAGRLSALFAAMNNEQFGADIINSNDKIELVFDSVKFAYTKEGDVLVGISFTLKSGEVLGIVGRIGSGKSTIGALINRLYRPTYGEIRLAGQNIFDISPNTFSKTVAYVSQDVFLFSDSIRNNISFGNSEATDEEIAEAAIVAAIHDEIMKFPDGYSSILGERGITLSGGQKQRVAIARALMMKPQLLVLDDAFSAIDSEKENEIINAILEKYSNIAIILISHRISTVRKAGRILFIENGQIAEDGSHNELIQRNGLYYDMFSRQIIEEELDNQSQSISNS